MKNRPRALALALAGALLLASVPQVPTRAENCVVYVGGSGSGENSGSTAEEPLASVYAAQELLPEGGRILVTDTIYIEGERSYSLEEGITLEASEELEGPVFEILPGGKLTLENLTLVGNESTVIVNGGVLCLDDSVSLQVREDDGVGCVYTADDAGTWLNGELVAGTADAAERRAETEGQTGDGSSEEESETGAEEPETDTGADGKEPGSESGTDAKDPGSGSGTDAKEPGTDGKEPGNGSGTDAKNPGTGNGTDVKEPGSAGGTDAKEPGTDGKEPGNGSGTDAKNPGTGNGTDVKEPGNAGGTDAKEPGTDGKEPGNGSGTDAKSPGTGSGTDGKEPGSVSGTDAKDPGTGNGIDGKEPGNASGTDAKTPGTESETNAKEPGSGSGTDAQNPGTDTEVKKPEDGAQLETPEKPGETETVIRVEAVKAVQDAIVALNIHSREDVKSLLAVSQAFDGLTPAEQAGMPEKVRRLLASAKEMAAAYNHTQLGVSVYGDLPWYVQFQVKLLDVGKKKEGGLEILVPYELKLWDLYKDEAYALPEGQSVTVTMPIPDVEIEGEFTVFHYRSDGSVETIRPVIHGDTMSFETSSFSPFSVAGSTIIAGIGIGSFPGNQDEEGQKPEEQTPESGSTAGAEPIVGIGTPSGSQGSAGGGQGSTSGGQGNISGSQGSTSGGNTGTDDYSSSGNTGNNYSAAANTGDATDILSVVISALAALLIIAGILTRRKREAC